MRFVILYLLTLSRSIFSSDYQEKTSLIKAFYQSRSVSLVTAYVCWGEYDRALFRELSLAGIRLAVLSGDRAVDGIVVDGVHRVGVVVDATCRDAKLFLEQASRMKLFTILRHWLIIDDTSPVTNATSEQLSAASATEVDMLPAASETMLTDVDMLSAVDMLPDVDMLPAASETEVDMLPAAFETMLSDVDMLPDVDMLSAASETMLTDVDMLPDSQMTWCQRRDGHVLHLSEIYRTCTGSPLVVRHVGEARRGGGGLTLRASSTSERGDLRGAVIRAATVVLYPDIFTGMFDTTTKHVDTWAKIHYPIALYLADQLNFRLEVVTVNSYGWREENGSFDGLIGLLQRGEIELTAAGIFMRLDRMEHVQFTADTFRLRTAIVFRQPSLSSIANIFVQPFNTAVWLSCITLCAVTLVVLAMQLLSSGTARGDCAHDAINWADVFTHVFAIVCQQGLHTTPNTLSGRVTVFAVSLASLFLFTSYSANIVALLQTPSSAIRSLADLVASPLKIGIENTTYNRVYIQESTDVVTRELVHRKLSSSGTLFYRDASDGMRCVRDGMYAFQVDTSVGYKVISETYTEREKCGLMEVELYPLPMFTMATARGSSYRELLGQRLRWQREAGLLDRLWKIWVTQKPICESSVGGFVSVGLIDFYPALVALQYGMIASLLVFFVEVIYFHRMKLVQMFVKPRFRRENEMKRAFNKVVVRAERRLARALSARGDDGLEHVGNKSRRDLHTRVHINKASQPTTARNWKEGNAKI